MKPSRIIPIVSVLAVVAWWFWPEPAITHPPGVLVPEEPDQRPVPERKQWSKNGYQILALARFHIRALVLHRERYRMGKESDLSPVDFALGWGAMSNQQIIDQIDISQSFRWYHWQSSHLPITNGDVITHSSNMHMIPADDDVEETLLSVIKGDVVELDGYLVEVHGQKGWKWVSSLRRDDTGDGACELVWVEKAVVHE